MKGSPNAPYNFEKELKYFFFIIICSIMVRTPIMKRITKLWGWQGIEPHIFSYRGQCSNHWATHHTHGILTLLSMLILFFRRWSIEHISDFWTRIIAKFWCWSSPWQAMRGSLRKYALNTCVVVLIVSLRHFCALNIYKSGILWREIQ